MGLLELGKSDTEAIMDALRHQVEEITEALSSGVEKASVKKMLLNSPILILFNVRDW